MCSAVFDGDKVRIAYVSKLDLVLDKDSVMMAIIRLECPDQKIQ